MPTGTDSDVAGAPATRRQVLGAGAALGVSALTGTKLGAAAADANEVEGNAVKEDATLRVAMLVFDNITQLDATAPMEVFARAGLDVFTVAPRQAPITAGCGLTIVPDHDYTSAPAADILCLPGGGGVNPLLTDPATLDWVRRTAAAASYVTSVCTGALLLGAAGLLEGKRATTHWASHHFLEDFGAIAVRERVVFDGDLITGGGVTAGMDFAFAVVEEIFDRETSALAMLALEYDPAPPFAGGSPDNTDANLVARYRDAARDSLERRAQQVSRAAALLRD